MNDALCEVAKVQREKTPFCERYIEFLQAGLAKEVQDAVLFNIVDWQWKKGELRTDRQYQHYPERPVDPEKRMSDGAFKANEAAIIANKSDAKILGEMVEFKEQNSLDMCGIGEGWFVYVTEGGEAPGGMVATAQEAT